MRTTAHDFSVWPHSKHKGEGSGAGPCTNVADLDAPGLLPTDVGPFPDKLKLEITPEGCEDDETGGGGGGGSDCFPVSASQELPIGG